MFNLRQTPRRRKCTPEQQQKRYLSSRLHYDWEKRHFLEYQVRQFGKRLSQGNTNQQQVCEKRAIENRKYQGRIKCNLLFVSMKIQEGWIKKSSERKGSDIINSYQGIGNSLILKLLRYRAWPYDFLQKSSTSASPQPRSDTATEISKCPQSGNECIAVHWVEDSV